LVRGLEKDFRPSGYEHADEVSGDGFELDIARVISDRSHQRVFEMVNIDRCGKLECYSVDSDAVSMQSSGVLSDLASCDDTITPGLLRTIIVY
jgi:hypothetical protein